MINMFYRVRFLAVLTLLTALAPLALQAEPQIRHWAIEGSDRKALIYAPSSAKTNASPLIFAFHGHSGTMDSAARTFDFQKLWPEAIVVYMQGLPTRGRLVDREGHQAGWQFVPGNENNRDIKFFDEVLAYVRKEYRVDDKRIYSTGHSNGGGFTYVLWAARGDIFAAVAPCSCVSTFSTNVADTASYTTNAFKPKPVFHLAGENDGLAKYEWQKLSMDSLRALDQCEEGQPWQKDSHEAWAKYCTLYPSKIGAPVVTFIHPGGHEYARGASEAIVKFFQENPQP